VIFFVDKCKCDVLNAVNFAVNVIIKMMFMEHRLVVARGAFLGSVTKGV
jgi:hypothetical protein